MNIWLIIIGWLLCSPICGWLMPLQDRVFGSITGGMKLTSDEVLRRIGYLMGLLLGPIYVISLVLLILVVAPIVWICFRLGGWIQTGDWTE